MGWMDSIKSKLYMDDADDMDDEAYEAEEAPSKKNTYSAPAKDGYNQYNISATAQLQVILLKPETYGDAKTIADNLMDRKIVVVNLEATSSEHRARILDFIGGVAYAQGGNLKPVGNNIYLISPYNVQFSGDEIAEELSSKGLFQ